VKISLSFYNIFVPFTALIFVGVWLKHIQIFFGSLRLSLVIFGKLWKSSENFWNRPSGTQTNFGKSSEIFRKLSEIFGKQPKRSLCIVRIYIITKIIWLLGDTKFLFSCWKYFKSELSEQVKYLLTLEDKFRISTRPHIILYILNSFRTELFTVYTSLKFTVNCESDSTMLTGFRQL